MQVQSIQVGRPRKVEYLGKEVWTGIFKSSVSGPQMLRKLNLEGDGQADLRVHGGRDKALYAYPCDAYAPWKILRPKDGFPFGAMGENLSMDSLPEDQIFVGDTYELGEAVIQATQPRFPCYKLGIKFGDQNILKQFNELNRPGVYFRVLKEGLITSGQTLKRTDRESILISILEMFELDRAAADPARIREILKLKSLNDGWRTRLQSWLED